MGKVLGIIFTIGGAFASVLCLFLCWNSSAHIEYHPDGSDHIGWGELGLVFPTIMFLGMFIVGIVFLTSHKEPELGEDTSGGHH